MDGPSQGQQSALSLHREFVGSRLDEQVLKQVFELVMPVHRQDRMDDEQPKAAADTPQVTPVLSQGAGQS